ncbi:hypothetical protein INT47_010842 [Mucor saturninus]|uniref:Reverse transcriptase zinc-binding domain-containing protein n=1 Tax=Mucor saturninus TaxID=64648 RepID=A0A8H7R045_9FUNG|nr:hypothetical protein INT47_010842 [Mucor saturninus]
MTDYIKLRYSGASKLNIQDLQQKSLLLLCLATMWRLRSDIGRLQYRDFTLRYKYEGAIKTLSNLEDVRIHVRALKESRGKSIQLGKLEMEDIYPVSTLFWFIGKDSSLKIRPSSVSYLILSISMQEAGIDTKTYKPHSIRAASSTKVIQLGNFIQKVKSHANWSLNSNTFKKYYYKPVAQESLNTRITNSFFSTENIITLNVGVESTRIVLGTTINTAPYWQLRSSTGYWRLGALLSDSLFLPKRTTTYSIDKWKTFWHPGILTIWYRAIHHKLPNKSLLNNIIPNSFPSAAYVYGPQTEEKLHHFLYDCPTKRSIWLQYLSTLFPDVQIEPSILHSHFA